MIKCVIFDIGDTLIRYNNLNDRIINDVDVPFLKSRGHKFDSEKIKAAMKITRKFLIENFSPRYIYKEKGLFLSKLADFLNIKLSENEALEWNRLREEHFRKIEELMPGALDILSFFKKKERQMVALTNTDRETAILRLKKFGIDSYFNLLLTSEDFGAKSELNAFKIVLERMNLSPDECLMVGNNPREDLSCLKLGIKAILLKGPDTSIEDYKEIKGAHIVNSLSEIKQLFESNF